MSISCSGAMGLGGGSSWDSSTQRMDSNLVYSLQASAMASSAGIPALSQSLLQDQVEAGVQMIRRPMQGPASNRVPLGSLYAATSPQQHLQGSVPGLMQTTGNSSSWSAALEISSAMLSPSSCSGAAAGLDAPAASLAAVASHCLAKFSSDPGFAQRAAAQFSSFSNHGNSSYGTSEIAPAYYAMGGGGGGVQELQYGGKPRAGRILSTAAVAAGDSAVNAKLAKSCSSSRLANLVMRGLSSSSSHAAGTVEESKNKNEALKPCATLSTSAMEAHKGRESKTSPAMRDDNKQEAGGVSSMEAFEGATGTGHWRSSHGYSSDEAHAGLEYHPSCTGRTTVSGSADHSIAKRKLSEAADHGDGKELPTGGNAVPGSLSTDGRDQLGSQEETKLLKRQRSGERCEDHNNEITSSCGIADQLENFVGPASSKAPEAPKQDYIHVRARRGQATDSHSLAERVRREKISERMKFLQDLVPGCSKITGKAAMLDEIINYVQSLQRQVEFLSMKLASVNPRLDFDDDHFLPKEMQSSLASTAPMSMMMHLDRPDPAAHVLSYGQHQRAPQEEQLQHSGLDVHNLQQPIGGASGRLLDFRRILEESAGLSLQRTSTTSAQAAAISAPLFCSDAFGDNLSQLSSVSWGGGELQSSVHMDSLHCKINACYLPQDLHCQMPTTGQMKVEL